MADLTTNIYVRGLRVNLVKNFVQYFVGSSKSSTFASSLKQYQTKEDWQSDRMRWTRNPVYPLPGIGGLNPSSSAKLFSIQKNPQRAKLSSCGFIFYDYLFSFRIAFLLPFFFFTTTFFTSFFFLIPKRSRQPLKSFFMIRPRPCVLRLFLVK